MSSDSSQSGVSGTIGAFNFIRRVGFPPTPEVVSIFCCLAIFSSLLSLPLVGIGLWPSFLFSLIVIALPVLVGELLNAAVFLRGDSVLDFRRLMGMELVSWSTLIILLPGFSLAAEFIGSKTLWAAGFLMVLVVSLPVRFITLFAMSTRSLWRKAVAAVLVPTASFRLCLSAASLLSSEAAARFFPWVTVFLLAIIASGVGIFLIISGVEREGSPQIGDSPMGLFRDFLRHWLRKEAGPLEKRLAALGTIGRIDLTVLAFDGQDGSKACLAVSNLHPGPYRDLGSGGLPSRLKARLESATGSISLIPHGISNHEYNIISQDDIEKLLEAAETNYPKPPHLLGSSPFVRETVQDAKASAQIFGDTALVTLTLAPLDMEDIPTHVLEAIEHHAQSKGLHVLVADAHNSLTRQTALTSEQAGMLEEAAILALDTACGKPQREFKVGASSDPLTMFGVEDGIGPGGLSLLIVETPNQRVGYLTIDGNNMETGFREMILNEMREGGIDEGEVMTTDTHLVAGVVRSPLGYHPVGENMNKELLLTRIRENLLKAANSSVPAGASSASFQLDLHVLGSSSFQTITSFVGRIARRIGFSFLRLEMALVLISIILLAVL